MKSWKALGVEPAAHGFFHLIAQLAQAGVSIKIGVGLAGRPEGVALDFLVSHGVREDDVILQDGQGLLAGELACLELAIQKCPGGSHQPMLKADQMAVGGLVRLDRATRSRGPSPRRWCC